MQKHLIPAALLVLSACVADRVAGVEPAIVAPQYEAPSAANGTAPLLLVNGKEVPASTDLTLEEILSVEVIKGKAAVDLYGKRGLHGVILVVTKAGASSVAR